ncbi:pyridoxamine 5'-phosphate oxidase family protein [Kitasatospora sp. NBC_01302]|uniref:pyridoxamine 5'-phosphate oxidase family protein n=1 Tax=Kitasatospora sp. NBC_01302 TaxID=2903575 RepID=UPI002E1064FF|nr:pyridoxamine 5'-phosphate oxidase family protein [Kitasatospora sp. NBC_01302]
MNARSDHPAAVPAAPAASGEELVRHRAGFARAGYAGPTRYRRMPAVAAQFLTAQPMLVVGAADAEGRVWAGLLTGRPGFLQAEPAGGSPDDDAPDTVAIQARPVPGDPLAEVLAAPAEVGSIAVEPARRRRMRMNGRAAPTDAGLRLTLAQVFSNCPKYIQTRDFTFAQPPAAGSVTALRGSALTLGQQLDIGTADTFFIATADRGGQPDASHRGGNPGFVRVLGPDRILFPDYRGNAMFSTLGNLQENPAAGLLFVDWETGTTLQLTGTARTDWDPAHIAEVPGAERLVEFTVLQVVELRGAHPLRWTEPGYSRFNPPAA